jgi:hypothetical protein
LFRIAKETLLKKPVADILEDCCRNTAIMIRWKKYIVRDLIRVEEMMRKESLVNGTKEMESLRLLLDTTTVPST